MLALEVRRRDRMQSVEELIEVLKPNGESEKPSVDVSEDQESTPEQVEEVEAAEPKTPESDTDSVYQQFRPKGYFNKPFHPVMQSNKHQQSRG